MNTGMCAVGQIEGDTRKAVVEVSRIGRKFPLCQRISVNRELILARFHQETRPLQTAWHTTRS